ncbi:hypothetical protein QR680_009241 [Steinernema hermaphroditum]|uniref:Uncharacterized protein n=1 Tax=Steinernema hermaphroditum TaxID=289476 RepID=A0AA39ILY1_9BILA|nr:hypothetical protein QR680_009241 [Steinernema hermaphroditum]
MGRRVVQSLGEDRFQQHRIATERFRFNLTQIEKRYCSQQPCGVVYNVGTGRYEVEASVEDMNDALERSRQMDHEFGEAVISTPELDENHTRGSLKSYRRVNSMFQRSIEQTDRSIAKHHCRRSSTVEERALVPVKRRRMSMFTAVNSNDHALLPSESSKRHILSMFTTVEPSDGHCTREQLHLLERSVADSDKSRLTITEITEEELPPKLLAITYPQTPVRKPKRTVLPSASRVTRSIAKRAKCRELVITSFAHSLYSLKSYKEVVRCWSTDVSHRTASGNFERCETVEKFDQNMRRVYARAKARNSSMTAGYCVDDSEPGQRKRRTFAIDRARLRSRLLPQNVAGVLESVIAPCAPSSEGLSRWRVPALLERRRAFFVGPLRLPRHEEVRGPPPLPIPPSVALLYSFRSLDARLRGDDVLDVVFDRRRGGRDCDYGRRRWKTNVVPAASEAVVASADASQAASLHVFIDGKQPKVSTLLPLSVPPRFFESRGGQGCTSGRN